MLSLCSLSLLTTENTDSLGSAILAFRCAHILMIKCASAMVVPVLPIPALQCTIAFSSGLEFNSIYMNSPSNRLKSSIESPVGTP